MPKSKKREPPLPPGVFRGKYWVYPWDEWFARDRFVLIQGRHYSIQTHGMISRIRCAAGTPPYRLKLRIRATSQGIEVVKVGKLPPRITKRRLH